jgi:hypothetical protein
VIIPMSDLLAEESSANADPSAHMLCTAEPISKSDVAIGLELPVHHNSLSELNGFALC